MIRELSKMEYLAYWIAGSMLIDSTCSFDCSNPINKEIHTQCVLSWKKSYQGDSW